MKKLTKNVIKDIVKECLVEILAEGLYSTAGKNTKATKNLKESMMNVASSSAKSKPVKRSTQSHLNSISYGEEKVNKRNEKLEQIARSATSDPILNEMLVDTAYTTLQEQQSAESNRAYSPAGRGDDAQKLVESSDPEELFGEEASSKWAALAFSG